MTRARPAAPAPSSAAADAVALVGIGCLFPKAPDLATYWRNVLAGADCLSDVPADHSWSPADYYDADPAAPDKTWATRGGFLDKVPFDPLQFGIPPAMLESIDTTQLLSLLVARETLRDAGLDPDGSGWDRDRVSVILGITGTQEMAITAGARLQGPIWRRSLLRCGVDPALADVIVRDIANHFPTWTEQTFPGLLGNVVSGRIANRLDLGGTNAVVDAACASSLAALQYAVADLLAGRSDLVLTGGADTLNDIFMFECFTRTPAFTKSGDARPFDASADGILIGEGIAMVALKRLADAERDGDRVYAVLKAVGSSSDGRYKSIYAPNPAGQAKALRRTYAAAGVDPATVELVEAHGTGTKAGDLAEIEALTAVYREARPTGRWAAIGSVKAQIGHTKSTAGAAGLVKAALALHQRVLPPAAKIERPNPKMAFERSPFYLSPSARPWVRAADHPRRAAVSAFGFGGSNFHAVLQEHGDARVPARAPAEHHLFLVGADSLEALADAVRGLDGATPSHASRASLAAWRPGARHVAAFVAGDDWRERIHGVVARIGGAPARPRDQIRIGGGPPAGKVAFLFPGQGSQYVEMGRTVAIRHARVREAFDAADEAFRQLGERSLSSVVFPPPAWTPEERERDAAALRDTAWAQPALGAFAAGLASLLGAFGVAPDALAGHSYGELVALHVAGSFDLPTLLALSRERGRLMRGDRGAADRGTMAAVDGPLDAVDEVLRGVPGAVLANRNHPGQGVVSGSRASVAAAIAALGARGMSAKELPVSGAFHSPLVADARPPFREALAAAALAAPRLPVVGCATAAPYPADPDAVRDALAVQIVSPVDFVGVVDRLWADGVRVFVEVGPKGVLCGLVEACLARAGREGAVVVGLDRSGGKEDGDLELKRALAALAAAGVPVDPAPLLAEPLPPVPPAPNPRAVGLAGANFRNPETLMPPMPPNLPRVPAGREAPAPTPPAAGWAAVPSTGAPMAKPVHLESDRSAAAPPIDFADLPNGIVAAAGSGAALAGASGQARGASTDVLALLESTRQTLAAFQDAQARTAEVHGRFLDAFAKANDNFARLFEAQARLVERFAASGAEGGSVGSAAGAEAPVAIVAPARVAPIPPAAPPAARPEPAPLEVGRVALPTTSRPAVATDLPPIFDALAAVHQKAAPKPAAPQTVPVVRGGKAEVQEAMLAAVATKTGYPRDALDLGMDLESDLGIDSIKRVEILSAVRDAVPTLPEVDNDRLAALRTLREVVDFLAALGGAAPEVPAILAMPTPPPSRDALVGALLEAVAAKTGYPREALELGMDLESDLGVDSIKRVEILSAVRDRVPTLPELDNDALAALRTLRDVADHLGSVAAGLGFALIGAQGAAGPGPALLVPPAAAPPAPAPEPGLPPVQSASEIAALPRRRALRRVAVTLAPAPAPSPLPPGGPWLVVGDDGLAAALRARGRDVVSAPGPGLGGVVWSGADPREAFQLARAVGAVPRFATVSRRGGLLGRSEPGPAPVGDPRTGGLSGLAKTLALEWPGARPLHLDAAPGTPVEVLVDELLSDRGTCEVGLAPDGGALTPVDALAEAPVVASPLAAGDLVVVTGGARGVTAACAHALAAAVRPALLLLGRSDPEREPAWAEGVPAGELLARRLAVARAQGERVRPRDADADVAAVRAAREARANLDALRALGAPVRYVAVDGRDARAVASAIHEAEAELGPVRGLVHGMGVLADRKLADKTDAQFDQVFGTKWEGFAALLGAVDPAELRYVCVFSSVAGRYGNAGQVDYAMANEALVQALHDLRSRHPHLRVKAIDWGPWDGGMVDETLRERFAERGHGLVPLREGATQFVEELVRPEVEVVVQAPLPASGRIERTLDPGRPWARDHRVGGRAVVPIALVAAWAVALAREVAPEAPACAIEGLRVLKGLAFAEAARVTITWARVGDRVEVGFESAAGRHYAFTVRLGACGPLPAAAAVGGDPTDDRGEDALFHGPAWRAVTRVDRLGPAGVVATVRGSAPGDLGEPGAAWLLDPVSLDGALQLLLVWVRRTFGAAALPTAIGRLRFAGGFGGGPLTVALTGQGDASHGRFGVTWTDAAGRPVAVLEDGEYATTPGLVRAFAAAS